MMYHTLARTLLMFGLLCAVSLTRGEESRLTCGRRRVKSVYLIHNGIDAKAGHWPWHATIYHQKVGKQDYACGGSVLDENTVLTAAHCVHTQRGLLAAHRVVVHVGRIQLNEESEHIQTHSVREIVLHPGFSRNSIMNDIALLKLSTNITMTKYVQPVCLWTMDSNQETLVGKNGTIVGFGLNEQDVVSNQLKQALIGVVDALTCIASDRAVFGTHLTSDMYCGKGQPGVSACNGDSGGGMFFEVGGKWFVRGLVSFTPLRANTTICDPLKYTAYTDVAKHLEWIVQHVDQRVLSFESDVLEIDYDEKLRLLNFETCGLKSSTYVSDNVNWTLPWLGFVRATNEYKTRCLVTLISEWYAVGPAFCFENDGIEAYVLFGNAFHSTTPECVDRNGTTLCAAAKQTLRIQRVIKHPMFGTNSSVDNIALIEFLYPADITQPNVQPICMPVMSELRSNSKTNLHVASVAWSNNAYKNIPVTYLNSTECVRQYAGHNITLNLQDKRLCAVVSSKQDDQDCRSLIAGSPLQEMIVLRNKERYFLRGFELVGTACQSKVPPLYNSVETYVDWILYNMRYNEADLEGIEVRSVNNSLDAQWLSLQQEPGNEKLRLFNMSSCGISKLRNERIGEITIHPWMVIIWGLDDILGLGVKTHGAGVLISEYYILTSAHAVQRKAAWRSVIFGMYNLLLQAECVGDDCPQYKYQEAAIRTITIHPNYSKNPRNYNIALIELELPANFTKPNIGAICMPFIRDLLKSKPLDLVVTAGDFYLRHKSLTELNSTVCQRQLAQEGFLTSAKTVPWCAVDAVQRGQAQLLLNAGAPFQALLQFDDHPKYFLRGINLRKDFSNELPYLPELFTNVERFLDWVVDNMRFKELNLTFPYEPERTTVPTRVNVTPIQNSSKRSLVNFNNCGIIPVSNETTNSSFIPWMGYLSSSDVHLSDSKDYRCVVTLINEWYAVGVPVCFVSNSQNYSVLLGVNSVDAPKECTETEGTASCIYRTQQIPVEKIIIHPHYNSSGSRNSIALVKLARAVDTSQPNVKPICLPLLDEVRSYDTSSLVEVAENQAGSIYRITRVDDRYIDSAECQKRWDDMAVQFAIENHKICTRLEIAPNQECYDYIMGSSLHTIQRMNSEDRHFLRGIQEIKPRICTLYNPLVYIDTDLHLEWILDNMEDRSYQLGSPYDLRKKLIFTSK